ncbi:MAG: gamma-glutamyl-phosphate reductase, partial [Deltaproteobacteria bacterium]|nr:gamma-glutamyl-phosphate reductase [Deltaproteobacteria bacterium]
MKNIQDMSRTAKEASIHLAAVDTDKKNAALAAIAAALHEQADQIIAANNKDIALSQEQNLAAPLLKRLAFGQDKIDGVIAGIKSLIGLADPVGET